MATLQHLLAQRIATIIHLETRGQGESHAEVIRRNEDEIERMVKAYMPSGSGFDSGTTIDMEKSTESRLVFNTSFHHMNDTGMYDGWTEHRVTVDATFTTPNIKISGRDRNGIKDYIADCFLPMLAQGVEPKWDEAEQEFTFTNDQGWKA